MNFDSCVTKQSETQPGVTFTIRVLNRIQRAKRDLSLVEQTIKITDLSARLAKIEGADEDLTEKERMRRACLDHEMGLLMNLHFKPAYIRAGLVSIEGLEIDGEPAHAESLINSGSRQLDDLIDEIYLACASESGLSEDQKKDSPSPTPLSEAKAADGRTTIASAA